MYDVDFAFTMLEDVSPCSADACNKLYPKWPYFSPSYFDLGVEWFYLVPSLFLVHLSIELDMMILWLANASGRLFVMYYK